MLFIANNIFSANAINSTLDIFNVIAWTKREILPVRITTSKTIELCSGISDLGHKLGQIVLKWDKSGMLFFSEPISDHFGTVRQNVLKSDLELKKKNLSHLRTI